MVRALRDRWPRRSTAVARRVGSDPRRRSSDDRHDHPADPEPPPCERGRGARHSAGRDFVAPLSRLGSADVDRAGGKGANLGEMVAAGFPVPGGFVVLAASFRRALEAARAQVVELNRAALDAARERASGATEDRLAAACLRLQTAIRDAGMPPGVADAVRAEYAHLGPDASVAVRSSAVGEDSATPPTPG